MPPSPIYDGGVLNQQDNFMQKEAENPDASTPESTSTGVQKAKPEEAPVTAPKKSEPDDEDSWLDDEETEQPTPKKSMPEETDEEPPFEEAEEPLSDKLASTSSSSKEGATTTGKTYKLRKVFFDYDRWEVKEASKEELNVLYSYLEKNPNVCVRLNAHTDSNGTNDYNLNLSQKRAQSVMDFLVDKGIDPIRLSAQGFGEELPVSSNDTHAGREQNRRVEFTQIGC
jgi:outer membrane protein OmpA-like peptidoglycan-associated protein